MLPSLVSGLGISALPRQGFSRRAARPVAGGLVLALLLSIASMAAVGPAEAATPSCTAHQLSARIASWQGAAGSRIADIRLVNTSFTPCKIRNFPRVQLVSSSGVVMINGAPASTTGAFHTLAGLGFLKTEASTSNYCGPAFTKPVTLALTLPALLGRVVAIPASPTDASGVPPCLGSPGSAGHISIHSWHT
jgi:uncharacterized protein DUF4232